MWALSSEGLASAWLPCSAVLLLPGVAALVGAGRGRHLLTLAGFAVSSTVLAWFRFSGRIGDGPPTAVALALMMATVALLGPTVATRRGRSAARRPAGAAAPVSVASTGGPRWLDPATAVIGGLLAGGAAGELWEPCVGYAFGSLLSDLPSRGIGGGAALAVHLAGILSPLLGLAALGAALPDQLLRRVDPGLALVGSAGLAILGLATAAGFHDELVGRLLQLSGG